MHCRLTREPLLHCAPQSRISPVLRPARAYARPPNNWQLPEQHSASSLHSWSAGVPEGTQQPQLFGFRTSGAAQAGRHFPWQHSRSVPQGMPPRFLPAHEPCFYFRHDGHRRFAAASSRASGSAAAPVAKRATRWRTDRQPPRLAEPPGVTIRSARCPWGVAFRNRVAPVRRYAERISDDDNDHARRTSWLGMRATATGSLCRAARGAGSRAG